MGAGAAAARARLWGGGVAAWSRTRWEGGGGGGGGGGGVKKRGGGGRVYVATHRRSAGMSEERDQKNLLNATSLECWASVLQERLKALTHRSNPKNLSGS